MENPGFTLEQLHQQRHFLELRMAEEATKPQGVSMLSMYEERLNPLKKQIFDLEMAAAGISPLGTTGVAGVVPAVAGGVQPQLAAPLTLLQLPQVEKGTGRRGGDTGLPVPRSQRDDDRRDDRKDDRRDRQRGRSRSRSDSRRRYDSQDRDRRRDRRSPTGRFERRKRSRSYDRRDRHRSPSRSRRDDRRRSRSRGRTPPPRHRVATTGSGGAGGGALGRAGSDKVPPRYIPMKHVKSLPKDSLRWLCWDDGRLKAILYEGKGSLLHRDRAVMDALQTMRRLWCCPNPVAAPPHAVPFAAWADVPPDEKARRMMKECCLCCGSSNHPVKDCPCPEKQKRW